MTIKEYLSQAYRIDQRINSKLEQVRNLRELAEKATSTLSDIPCSGNGNKQKIESVVVKIIDLEHEIDEEIDRLVDLKQEIVSLIKQVKNPEYQTLLELRYLCFRTWEQIAVEMSYDLSLGSSLTQESSGENKNKPLKTIENHVCILVAL